MKLAAYIKELDLEESIIKSIEEAIVSKEVEATLETAYEVQ